MSYLQQPPVRFRIWDTVEKKWVKDGFNRNTGEVREFFINQNGDLWLHESDPHGKFTLTPEHNLPRNEDDGPRYIKRLAIGMHDVDNRKLYYGDILKFTDKDFGTSYGVLISIGGAPFIGSGPIGNYTAADAITAREAAKGELAGNIFEHPHLIQLGGQLGGTYDTKNQL